MASTFSGIGSWLSGVSPGSPASPSTSPPFTPARSPWAVRASSFRSMDEVLRPDDAIDASESIRGHASTTKPGFRFLSEDVTDDEDDAAGSDSDSGTVTVVARSSAGTKSYGSWGNIRSKEEPESESEFCPTPKGPVGARSPEYDSQATEISCFSMSNLPATNPHRRIAASEVRAQTLAIPNEVMPRRMGYPHPFGNIENLAFANRHPLIEHPLTPEGPWSPGTRPGMVRIVTNQTDRSSPEVMYHDETQKKRHGSRHSPFSKAVFRGRDRSTPTGLEEGFWRMGFN